MKIPDQGAGDRYRQRTAQTGYRVVFQINIVTKIQLTTTFVAWSQIWIIANIFNSDTIGQCIDEVTYLGIDLLEIPLVIRKGEV